MMWPHSAVKKRRAGVDDPVAELDDFGGAAPYGVEGVGSVRFGRFAEGFTGDTPRRTWAPVAAEGLTFVATCDIEVARTDAFDAVQLRHDACLEAYSTTVVQAQGAPLAEPITVVLRQVWRSGDIDGPGKVAAPYEHGMAFLSVLAPGVPVQPAREFADQLCAARYHPPPPEEEAPPSPPAPLTEKYYYVPNDTLHLEEWNSGPATVTELADAVRGANTLPEAEIIHVFAALLHALYEPAAVDSPLRGFEAEHKLYAEQTCLCVVPAVLCRPTPCPYRGPDSSAFPRLDVLLQRSAAHDGIVCLDEWSWPLVTAWSLRNGVRDGTVLFGLPPSQTVKHGVKKFVAVTRAALVDEVGELEKRLALLKTTLHAGDAATAANSTADAASDVVPA